MYLYNAALLGHISSHFLSFNIISIACFCVTDLGVFGGDGGAAVVLSNSIV